VAHLQRPTAGAGDRHSWPGSPGQEHAPTARPAHPKRLPGRSQKRSGERSPATQKEPPDAHQGGPTPYAMNRVSVQSNPTLIYLLGAPEDHRGRTGPVVAHTRSRSPGKGGHARNIWHTSNFYQNLRKRFRSAGCDRNGPDKPVGRPTGYRSANPHQPNPHLSGNPVAIHDLDVGSPETNGQPDRTAHRLFFSRSSSSLTQGASVPR